MVFIAIAGFSAIARSVMIFAGMELVSFDLGTGFSAIARSVMIFALSMHSHQDTKQGSFSAIARSVMIFA